METWTRPRWLAGLVALTSLGCGLSGQESTPAKPNIVVILTDDQTSSSMPSIPHTQSLLAREGTSFTNFFVNDPMCCPSRVSIQLGQYQHNHGIETAPRPSSCGYRFMEEGKHRRSLGKRVHDAGYRTSYLGKYMNSHNRYIARVGAEEKEDHLLLGWDDYHVLLRRNFYGFKLHENGRLTQRPASVEFYQTDVLGRMATRFIEESAAAGTPFLLFVAPDAPHQPAKAPPRHRRRFADRGAPRVPSFNEADVSGQPALSETALLEEPEVAAIDERYRRQLRSLQAVDEMVLDIVVTLLESGQLENTYLFFASDNGFHYGEHRLVRGKGTPFEEAVRVPLVIRGPGVVKDRTLLQLAANVDILPTVLELVGAAPDEQIDGRSLVPLFGPGAERVDWRNAVVLESREGSRNQGVPAFGAIRTNRFKWIEYETGDRALYDLAVDPYERTNVCGEENEAIAKVLSAWLHELLACRGDSCRRAENGTRERLTALGDSPAE